MSSVGQGVVAIIGELLNLSAERVTLDAELVDGLGAKHVDLIDMALEIETDFEIVVCWERFSTLLTVRDVVAYVEMRLSETGAVRVRMHG